MIVTYGSARTYAHASWDCSQAGHGAASRGYVLTTRPADVAAPDRMQLRRSRSVERLPFAQLGARRSRMMERLGLLPITDAVVRQRALTELEARVQNWWGGALPPVSRFADAPPNARPAVLAADPAELWIVGAISPSGQPAIFGVEAGGASAPWITPVSFRSMSPDCAPLLDDAAALCRHTNGGGGSPLVERAGRFFTDFEADAGQALAVVK